MRAAVLTQVNKPLEILDLEQEPPKANEVRVQVKAAGVCMSDWHIMNGDWPMPLPMVLGHEAAGIVVENGPGVTTPAMQAPAPQSLKPSLTRITSCRTPSRPLQTARRWTPGRAPISPSATRSTRWPTTLSSACGCLAQRSRIGWLLITRQPIHDGGAGLARSPS